MAQKIKGSLGEDARVLILDESNFSVVEVSSDESAGSFDIEVPASGTKTVLARKADGETMGYGNITSVYEAPGFQDYSAEFGVNSYIEGRDAYVRNGIWYPRPYDILLGYSAGNNYSAWYWVPSVTIPRSATILSANYKVEVRAAAAGQVGITMKMYDISSAPYLYSSSAYNAAAKTTGVSANISPGATGTIFTFPDIASEVQQVVDRGDWNSGQNMGLFIEQPSGNRLNLFRTSSCRGASLYGHYYNRLAISWRVYA